MPRIKIAYLCDQNPLDRNLYSGGNARIHDALQKHVGDVTILSQGWHWAEPLRRAIHALPEALHLRTRWRAHLALAPIIAKGVQAELARGQYDVLFGAYSFQSMARVRPPYPMLRVFTSDATQTTYRDSDVGAKFGSYFSASRMLDPWVKRQETRMLRDMDLTLWPSAWVKDLAEHTYGLRSDQSHLVPWGAGIDAAPDLGPQPEIGRDHTIRLILIGRDWFAKGGPVAFDTMQELRARGLDARLTVVGCIPPDFHRNEWVEVVPGLNKSVPDEMAEFAQRLGSAHFVVTPSHESYGFAFCEASAYGTPSLCLRIGGVPIRDGINGYALPKGATPADFADRIVALAEAPLDYAQLRKSTRTEFDTRLNWDSWGRSVADLVSAALSNR